MRFVRPVLLTLLLAALAAFAAACGSSSSGGAGDADPAAAAPAAAPVYIEATVRPDGKLGDDVNAVLKRVLRTNDPAAKLKGLIDKSGRKDGITYDKDIAPWLGKRVGVAITNISGSRPQFVAIAGSKDDDKARTALNKGSKVTKRSYKGVDYTVSTDKNAYAAFGGRAYVGTEGGLRSAIDATKGTSLAESNGLRAAREKVASERAGFMYFDTAGLLALVQRSAGAADPQIGAAIQTFASALPKTIAAALEADPDLIRIDAASLGTPKAAAGGKSGAAAVAKQPGDAFAAVGIAQLGQSIDRQLKTLGGSGLGGVGLEALLRQVRTQTGLDVRADLLSWMGDAGISVSGTSLGDLHGALVVDSTNPAKTAKAIAALQRLARGQAGGRVRSLSGSGVDRGFTIAMPGAPRIDVALAGSTFVIAVGPGALKGALNPAGKLGDAPAFRAAAGKLGDGIAPSFFLDMTKLTALIGSKASSSPTFAQAKPYLDSFAALVAGAKDEGEGVTRARFAITLK